MLNKVRVFLSDSDNRHTVIHSSVALLIRFFGAGMAFIFNLIIARKLGTEQAGYFFLSFAAAMLLSSVSQLGLENTVLRFTGANSTKPKTIKHILNYALKFSLPFALVIAVLIYILAPSISQNLFDKPGMTESLRFIAPSIIGLGSVFIIAMSLQARHFLFASIPCQNIAHFLFCIALVLVFDGTDASVVSLYLSLSLGVSASLFYWYSIKSLSDISHEEEVTLGIDSDAIWNSARPNWITALMIQSVQWCSPIIVGMYLAVEQVAFFSVAQRIALLTSFVFMAVNLVVAPKFAAFQAKNDFAGIRRTALFSVRLLVCSVIPIIFLLLVFPEFLMGLFGEEFKQGAFILQILVIGQAVNVLTGPVGFILTMSGYERDMRFVTIISGVSMLIFVPLFTNYFGVTGAATVTSFCISMQNIMAAYFVNKRLGFNTLKFWQKI